MIPVLLTGAKGQLGSEIQRIAADNPCMSFIFTDIEELDITSKEAVSAFLDANPVRYLVNCAAYTAVDRAEDEPEMAMQLNGNAVNILAGECARRGIQLIHISTDYVFDGEANRPYTTDHPVNPQSAYGKSKLAGEEALRKSGTGTIIRTSWLYSVYGNNFVKTILRLSREKDELDVVFDQTGSPTNAADLASAILEMIMQQEERGEEPEFAIYHYSNRGICSWYEFARAIMEFLESACRVRAVESKDFPTKALRPRYSVLDTSRIVRDYGIQIPHWRDSLGKCIRELVNQ